METFALLVALAALVIGLAAGWFFGSRPVAEWKARHEDRDREARELDSKYLKLLAEAEQAKERAARVDALDRELRETRTGHDKIVDGLRQDHGRLSAELATLKSGTAERERALEERYAERERHFERELARLAEAEEKLQAKFNEIGEKLLEGAHAKFLEGAGTQLASLNKESLAELEKKVGPVGETLERYRRRVEELEKGRAEAWHQLQGVIGEVRAGQERVVEGANRITTTLRGATKARGDWGELQLENLLESCGLSDRTDFRREVGLKDEHGNDLRPDAIINIPGGRKLVVDVKNVFNTYAAANEAVSEEERQELLKAHARELRTHITALSGKRYQDHVEGSADFVIMFVPGEHVLYAALTQDHGLLDFALSKRIVLSSPLNFMSIALTVSTVWRQAGVQADAQEIAQLGKELYDRLGIVARYLSNLRRDLGKANDSFDKLVGSFDKNLRRTGERFEELNVDTSAKELHEAPPLGHQPRRLANFPDGEEEAA
jgi:DNA recombination protein RmuC